MTSLARQHALEVSGDLGLDPDRILRAYDIVESAVGADWLTEQEQQSERHRVKISDAQTLVRVLATPTHAAHAEVCELALYLETFRSDPRIGAVIQDLRTPKYTATLMELAFAYRWRDAGAQVRPRPATRRGEADFEAVISGLPYVVETSLFADEMFKTPRFRLPQIIGQALRKVQLAGASKLFVTIDTYPGGDIDRQLFEAVLHVCRSFASSGAATAFSHELPFARLTLEPITGDPEYNPFIEAMEEEPWDICFRHVQRQLPVGQPIYRVLDHEVVTEVSRIFVKFPEDDTDIYNALYRKLRKEAAQLSGVEGPRVVILDSGALGEISGYDHVPLREQIARVMRNIPELVCVWVTMRRALREHRYRYFSLIIPNPDSIYQVPNSFISRCATREWRWDYLPGRNLLHRGRSRGLTTNSNLWYRPANEKGARRDAACKVVVFAFEVRGLPSMPVATSRKLQEELEFFERQRLELLARAPGKFALIKGSELVGIFDTEIEAARAGYRQIGNEPFLIKHIVEADVPLIFTSFNIGV